MSILNPAIEHSEQKSPALPAWRVIWEMMRFRPWLWFIDLLCVSLIRFCWQIAPALTIKAFFDMLTGAAPLGFGIWAIVAFAMTSWVGRVLASYGFYYADVPIFADMSTLLRKNLLRYILKRPGAATLPDSPGEAVSRFKNDVNEIPLFVILINDIMVGIAIISIAIFLMAKISPSVTAMALVPLLIVGIVANIATGRIEHYRTASRQAAGKVTGFIGEFFGAGTLGASMVEGRISAGVVVGDGSDVGGGASIMGTLSGGGKQVISIGRRCLLGANSGLGISLGDDCVVEAGLYVTAGTKVTLQDGSTAKAADFSGASNVLFRRNSVSGAVEAVPWKGEGIALNAALHAND